MEETFKTLSSRLESVVTAASHNLQNFDEDESTKPILAGGWSPHQVLGHLVDSASNNHQRFVRAAIQDSLVFPGYDQAKNVEIQRPQEAAWNDLVTLWAAYNRYLSHVIAHLPDEKGGTVCKIADNDPVTLRFLVEDYIRHLIHHLRQLGAFS